MKNAELAVVAGENGGAGEEVLLSSPGELPLRVRYLGRTDYGQTWQAMVAFTAARNAETRDVVCRLDQTPVAAHVEAGKRVELLPDLGLPLVKTDRGGQITYHGPGQVVIYLLLDLERRKLRVRELVSAIEQAVIDLLAAHGVAAERHGGAPGVYVGPAKVAALGLRVRKSCCYHGVSLNVEMDLSPFSAINPCGYPGMPVTQTRDLGISLTPAQATAALVQQIAAQLEHKP